MRAIMVMFDSLNRRFLSPYGCKETITPNFGRLSNCTVQFDNSYVGSLPCIPARRELHTGRYNFLHRSWGPMEPFDDSVFHILHNHGIHTHLVSDHGHYWECGGATYHTQYSTWEAIRGQEGDAWASLAGGVEDNDPNFVGFTEGLRNKLYRQNLVNRTRFQKKEDYPLVKTFDAGLDFLKENKNRDNWFLQIESFSPHEPFAASGEFKELYSSKEKGKKYEWPDYAPVKESQEEILEVRYAYFASLTMCDEQLGRVLDFMDAQDMWKDTMLIVNTDHGYLLGEHGYWAKNYMPCYDEIVHTPLFIWNPYFPKAKGVRRKSLVQTIDIPVTLLKYFRVELEKEIQGKDMAPVLENDEKIREWGLFGMFGGQVCCTNGRYVYMRFPKNLDVPLYEYTLMPTHMMDFFCKKELISMEKHEGFNFTKHLPVMRIETERCARCVDDKDYLFDLSIDPEEIINLDSPKLIQQIEKHLYKLMVENEAPKEVLIRFGLEK